ncbi:uncharacterized protein LOC113076649 isoform X1 [Tachysurus ichikawai]
MTFPELNAKRRTDESFRQATDEEHHIQHSPLTDIGIDMVTCFPHDYMHLVCLGVMRRLLDLWISTTGPLHCRISSIQASMVSDRLIALRNYIPCEFARRPLALSDLYGEEFLVYNIHGLVHLSEDVKIHGNLDLISGFPFENFKNKNILFPGEDDDSEMEGHQKEPKSKKGRHALPTCNAPVITREQISPVVDNLHLSGQSSPDLHSHGQSSPDVSPHGQSSPQLRPHSQMSHNLRPSYYYSPDLYADGHSTPEIHSRPQTSTTMLSSGWHVRSESCTSGKSSTETLSRHADVEVRKTAHKSKEIHKKGTLNLQGHTTPGTSSKHPVTTFVSILVFITFHTECTDGMSWD